MQPSGLPYVCRPINPESFVRATLRPYFALLLLLCLVRTLLPEAWVVELHRHAHTTEEPAFAKAPRRGARSVFFTPKHTHCHTEQFYNVPFVAAPPVVVPLPRVQLSYRPLAVPTTLASSAVALRRSALRGPPAG